MMASHSASDQVRYLGQWFRTWSDYQKDDFLHVLASKLSPNLDASAEVNGIVDGIEGISMNATGRAPSLFKCQIKLFNEWWASWAQEERGSLTEELKKSDSKFWEDLQSEVDGTRKKEDDDFFVVEDFVHVGGPSATATTTTNTPVLSSSDVVGGVTLSLQNSEILTEISSPSTDFAKTIPDDGEEINETEEEGKFRTTIEVTHSDGHTAE